MERQDLDMKIALALCAKGPSGVGRQPASSTEPSVFARERLLGGKTET